jgi:hypothetical protein
MSPLPSHHGGRFVDLVLVPPEAAAKVDVSRVRRLAALALAACGPNAAVDASEDAAADASDDDGPTSTSPPLDDDDDEPPPLDLDSPADSSGTSSGPIEPEVECATFDPSRVYLRGTLEQGASNPHALTDPENPTDFCVGFETDVVTPRLDGDGRVLFVDETDGDGVYAFAPDPLDWDPAANTWIYPTQPYANDDLVLPAPCDAGTELARILVSPTDGGVWYRCAGSWFDPSGTLAFGSTDPIGVAVALDGRLLVNDPEHGAPLFFVTPGGIPEPSLDLPREIDAVVTGRVHDGGLRIVAIQGDRAFLWHLVGESIGEEGEYSAFDIGPSIVDLAQGALDGDGDFLHVIHATDANDLVVRRRLDPDPSEVVYDESDLDPYAVRVGLYDLFTGP